MTPEQRQVRLHHHMYETCEGIQQQSERIVALEELVGDMLDYGEGAGNGMAEFFADRIDELEVPL